jgi:DNA-binding LytR/AlgR family response regulator
MRVLLVEDDTALLTTLRTLLPLVAPAISVIGACTTLAEARVILAREAVDLIITDNHLPDGKGIQLLVEAPDTPLPLDIILMTGNICPDVVQVLMMMSEVGKGSGSLLPKPFSWTEFLPLLKAIAEKRGHNPHDYARPLVFSQELRALTQKHTHSAAASLPPTPTNSRPQQSSMIHIRHNYEDLLLPIASIRYFESDKHKVIIHTDDGKRYSERCVLNTIEERVREHGFIRTHRGYVVNVAHIEKLILGFAVLRDCRKLIPIAKDNDTLVKDAWFSFHAV